MTRPLSMLAILLLGAAASVPAGRSDAAGPAPDPDPIASHPEPAKVRSLPGTDFGAWEHGTLSPLATWPPPPADPAVDVLHYDLDLTFDTANPVISGTATLTLAWGSQAGDVLRLDLVDLPVSAVRDGGGTPLAFTQDATGVNVTVAPAPARGDTVTVALDYGGTVTSGYEIRPQVAYTFTEPEDARHWFPCRDLPSDKATLALHGRVPSGMILVSNGVLDSTTTAGSDPVYHWREDHPLATYLMCASISAYSAVSQASPITPLTWYVYPADASAARNSFRNVYKMVAFYDSTLVPWPFDKYAMCESELSGGMEHQSATLLGSFIVRAGLNYEWITAHELAHQWFGDLVTCGSWADVWLNEGFATFYEAVWQGAYYGGTTFDDRMLNAQNQVFNAEQNGATYPILDPPANALFNTLVYYKGAWVLRMLRDLMGKASFDAAIVDYLNDHAYGSAVTDDLRAEMEAHYGAPLDWFFDQWLGGTLHPKLLYVPVYSLTGSGWIAQIDVRQTQGGSTVYRFPLEVRITTAAGDTTVTGWVNTAHDVLTFAVNAQPTGVVLDPANKLLDQHTLGTAVAVPQAPPVALRAWPNPFHRALRLDTSALGDAAGPVEVFDVRGRRVRTLDPGPGGTAWDGTDDGGRLLPPGAYFLRLGGTGRTLRVVRLP